VGRYRIQRPEDYVKYNRICGQLRALANKLSLLPPTDPIRQKHEDLLLQKLFDLGVLGTGGGGKGKLSDVENKVTVSAFCRRRLPVVMQKLGMAQTLEQAATYIEQQHVRVGVELVTDPAFLVSR
jgi:U3 small nucleolar ribonucleoprotein protein IMP3